MARVTLVVGQAQQGKTTLALRILQREAVRGIILDPVRSKPFQTIVPAFQRWTELCTFLESPGARGRWIVILRSMDFSDYVWALRAAPFYRHVTLLVDEGLTFASDSDAIYPLIKLCRMNAHFGGGIGVPVMITAQRPLDLPRDIRSQADRWFSFRQEEPGDLQYLSERCNPEFADRVAGLGPHQWLTFPSTLAAAGVNDAQGQGGSGLRTGRDGSAGAPAHGPAAERDSEAAGADGRLVERVVE